MKDSIIKNKTSIKIQTGTIIVLILIWYILSLKFSSILIPSPFETLQAIWKMVVSGELFEQLLLSGTRILFGFIFGMSIAMLCGMIAGYSSYIYEAFRPIVSLILGIPPIILVVLVMVWFGTGGVIPIFVISVLVFPTFFLNTANGWRAIDRQLLEMATVYRCSRFTIFKQIIMPSLSIPILTAISLAAGSAVRIGIMAELLGSDSGIGASLAMARVNINTDKVFAWTFISVLLIVCIDHLLIQPMKKSILKWQKEEAH